jgi:hypothetical protein
MLRRGTVAMTLLACLLHAVRAHAELSVGQNQIVVDGVVLHFGDTIDVAGVCIKQRGWGHEYGIATLRALRIGGKPTQEHLEFHLRPNTGEQPPTTKELAGLKPNKHYRVRGPLLNAQINGLDNECSLLAERVEEIAATDLKVADFVGREATFEGIAASNGTFQYNNEAVRLAGLPDWPEKLKGKHVSVRGIIRKNGRELLIERPTWRLYQLEDLLNQPVVLDGVIASLNDNWWFRYRGERMYLTSDSGPVLRFHSRDHYRTVRVRGKLVRQDRPSLDQITLKTARDLAPTYVIRGAKVERLGDDLTWEQKFGPVYPSHQPLRNGVPELLAESSFRRNLLGNETSAMLFAERNSETIKQILHGINSEHRDELSRRMSDEKMDHVLRLLYAAMLANVNDDRGCAYLLDAAQIRDDVLDLNALYCLGAFPFLAADHDRKVDLTWVEKPLIDLIGNMRQVRARGEVLGEAKDKQRTSAAACAVLYSAIPSVLRQIGSEDCRKALLAFLSAHAEGSERVAIELCAWKPPLSADALLQVDELVEDRHVHRTILRLLLAQKSPKVVDRYLDDLADGFVYMDFRDQPSAQIVSQLKARLDRLDGEVGIHARMLIALGEDDPVIKLLQMLDDPQWADKNIVLFELARLADVRAIAPVARFLREAPASTVKDDDALAPTNMVEHGLDAIAHTGTASAIHELIELLPVDLARFGGYLKRDEWKLIVAAHLIELTGESFGTDVERWRVWQRAHSEHHVPRELANPRETIRTNPGSAIDLGQ